jgi:hypothetical protein
MIASWSFNPRFYPPGDAVLFAPVALLYHFTSLSFARANLLALCLLLVYAHVSLYLLLRATDGEPLRALTLLVVYFPLIHWTLEGFYDGALLAPLVACALLIRRRRGIEALLAFCVAAAIHFRAFFYAPWAMAAAILVVRQRQWRSWGAPEWAMAAGCGALSVATLVPFAILKEALGSLGYTNLAALQQMRPEALVLAAIAGVAAILLLRARAWLELAMLLWITAMLFSLHQAEQWHAVVLLAWLCAPAAGSDLLLAVQARLWFVLGATAVVFRDWPIPSWLARLFA